MIVFHVKRSLISRAHHLRLQNTATAVAAKFQSPPVHRFSAVILMCFDGSLCTGTVGTILIGSDLDTLLQVMFTTLAIRWVPQETKGLPPLLHLADSSRHIHCYYLLVLLHS